MDTLQIAIISVISVSLHLWAGYYIAQIVIIEFLHEPLTLANQKAAWIILGGSMSLVIFIIICWIAAIIFLFMMFSGKV